MSSTILAQFAIAIYCRITHSRFSSSHFSTCHMSQVCQACNMFRFLIFFISLNVDWFESMMTILCLFVRYCYIFLINSDIVLVNICRPFAVLLRHLLLHLFGRTKRNCNRSVKWSQNNHNNDYDGDCNAKWMDGWMAGWMNESLREWVNWKSGSRGGRTKSYMEVRKCVCVEDNAREQLLLSFSALSFFGCVVYLQLEIF